MKIEFLLLSTKYFKRSVASVQFPSPLFKIYLNILIVLFFAYWVFVEKSLKLIGCKYKRAQ